MGGIRGHEPEVTKDRLSSTGKKTGIGRKATNVMHIRLSSKKNPAPDKGIRGKCAHVPPPV